MAQPQSQPPVDPLPQSSQQRLNDDDANNANTRQPSTNNTKTIFVTVGTTLFTSLIDHIIHPNTIQTMIRYNYTHLIIQYGKQSDISNSNTTTTTTTTSTGSSSNSSNSSHRTNPSKYMTIVNQFRRNDCDDTNINDRPPDTKTTTTTVTTTTTRTTGSSNNQTTSNNNNSNNNSSNIHIELYDFKSSLQEDMEAADLIICHAGAGTLTEAIRIAQQQQEQQQQVPLQSSLDSSSTSSATTNRKKKTTAIVTVINTSLMDNHQTELAFALQRRNLVHVVNDPREFSSESVSSTTTSLWDIIEQQFLANGSCSSRTTTPSSLTAITPSSFDGNPYDVPRILHAYFDGGRSSSDANEEKEE